MKHFYAECPYNPDGPTPWYLEQTNCPWCMGSRILYYEREYRYDPEGTIKDLNWELQ